MDILKPFRAHIDAIDEEIIRLLRARYDIIAEVGNLKAREGIPAIIPERVRGVVDRAAHLAAQKDLDAAFIRDLFQRLVDHSCALEETIIRAGGKQKKAAP